MKLRFFVILVVALGYLAAMLACNSAPPTAALSSSSTATQPGAPDGVDPPHAVDTAGRPIPESSTTMPDKPIILAKDSEDQKWGEHKPDAAFDHVKHTTDVKHTLDGKTVTACVECHHTEQPSAPAGQQYLKTFNKERKEVLTSKQLETSKVAVKSCRACHFQPSADETDEFPPQSVTYPKELNKPPSGRLYNDVAYHTNCITCHETAKTRDPQLNAPQKCGDCHTNRRP